MSTGRWRLQLVEERETLPARWEPPRRRPRAPEPPGERAVDDLLGAFDLLARRGTGQSAWVVPFRHNPIAFLLDTVSDAANVWGPRGELLYQNRAAAELGVGSSAAAAVQRFTAVGRWFERRCVQCRAHGAEYTLELIREVPPTGGQS